MVASSPRFETRNPKLETRDSKLTNFFFAPVAAADSASQSPEYGPIRALTQRRRGAKTQRDFQRVCALALGNSQRPLPIVWIKLGIAERRDLKELPGPKLHNQGAD